MIIQITEIMDYSKQQDINLNQLYSLLTLAKDHQNECSKELEEARERVIDLKLQISKKEVQDELERAK